MENLYAIENESLRVEISDAGAELRKIILKETGEQLMWTGDPDVWRGRAPWLFPVIGRLKDDYYTYQGARYDLPMHGFARKMTFAAEQTAGDAVTFTLPDTPETRAVYPWRFALEIGYRLTGKKLDIRCVVRNRDDKAMFFSLGAHPGFLCGEGDRLRFDGLTSLTCRRLTGDSHLLRAESTDLPLEDHGLTLRGALFNEDALLIERPAVAGVTLIKARGAAVRLSFDPVPWLGVWAKPVAEGLRYICLEPWLGVDDPVGSDHDIEHKESIQTLAAGGEASFNLSVEPA